jgi:hypothetical protein
MMRNDVGEHGSYADAAERPTGLSENSGGLRDLVWVTGLDGNVNAANPAGRCRGEARRSDGQNGAGSAPTKVSSRFVLDVGRR